MNEIISRREFLTLLSASVASLGINQGQLIDYIKDNVPLAKPAIYLDVDSMAFFNVPHPKEKTIRVSELMKIEPIPMHWPIEQKVSWYLPPESVYYFTTSPKDNIKTITVIGQCVVFGAYTTYPNDRIKSSGVYHAKTLPPDKSFEKRMSFFIDTLRPRQNQAFFIKGNGNYGYESQEQLVRDLESILKKKDVRIKDYSMDAELVGKINSFYPSTGKWANEIILANRD